MFINTHEVKIPHIVSQSCIHISLPILSIMKFILSAAILFLLLSCNQSPKKDDVVETVSQDTVEPHGVQPMPDSQAVALAAAAAIPGKIIGWWHAEEGLGASLYLYEDSTNQLRMRTAFLDGNSMDNPITKSVQNGKIRYDDDIGLGEYYLVESNGNLGLYGEDGKFDEAVKK